MRTLAILLLSVVAALSQEVEASKTQQMQVWSGNSRSNSWVGGRFYAALPFTSNPSAILTNVLTSMTVPAFMMLTNGDAIELRAYGAYMDIQNEKQILIHFGSEQIFDTGRQKITGNWYINGLINRISHTNQYYYFRAVWPGTIVTKSGICNQTNTLDTLLILKASSITARGVTNEAFLVDYFTGPHSSPTP